MYCETLDSPPQASHTPSAWSSSQLSHEYWQFEKPKQLPNANVAKPNNDTINPFIVFLLLLYLPPYYILFLRALSTPNRKIHKKNMNTYTILSIFTKFPKQNTSPRIPTGAIFSYSVFERFGFLFPCLVRLSRRSPAHCRKYTGYFFMQRPRLFRSLDFPSLFISCWNTSRFCYRRSSLTYLLFSYSFRPPVGRAYVYVGVSPSLSVLLFEVIRIMSHTSFQSSRFYRSTVTLSEYKSRNPVEFLCLSLRYIDIDFFLFFGFNGSRLYYGKESSLFVPSFPLFFCRVPAAACRPLSALFYTCMGVFSIIFLKDTNIFCSFLSLLYLYYNR